jgi:Uma2 family endonuclease
MEATTIRKRLFTVEEYHRMSEAGILAADERVELIEGEIVQMAAIGSPHAGCVNRLTNLLAWRLGQRAVVAPQNPVRLGDRSEPQPDLALVRPRADFYSASHPVPEDVLLLVEVACSSLPEDRRLKVPLYARHGINEVWLVDLDGERLEVYREPAEDGYRNVQLLGRGQRVRLGAFPELELTVDEVLG